MRLLTGLLAGIVLITAATVGSGQLGAFRGTPPIDLGVQGGRLKAPSATPNSVSSQADLEVGHPMRTYARIEPLRLAGDGPATMQRLRRILEARPDARVVLARDDYLRVEFTTRWMRFVDDAEFWFDPAAQVVQVRSASRLGRKDYGVNRERIEQIRRTLTSAPPPLGP